MMDYVNRYSTFVYKLVKINEYGKNYDGTQKERVSYYSNMEALAERVTDGESVKDIHAIDEVRHQYPNENVYCITKRIYKKSEYSWEQNRIWFKHIRYERKDKIANLMKQVVMKCMLKYLISNRWCDNK